MAIYPSELPAALSSTSYEIDGNIIQTTLQTGAVRLRRRFTNSPKIFSFKFLFTADQLEQFNGFHRHTLNNGTEPLQIESQEGTVTGYLNNGKYSVAPASGNELYNITFQLRVDDPPVQNESIYILKFLFGNSIAELDRVAALVVTEANHFSSVHNWGVGTAPPAN